ncbi:MAG: AtuA-related protein, partial [Gemmatimonadota bacterium]
MRIPLGRIAIARSGDKGDTANVGVIALAEEAYPIIVQQLTAERIKRHFNG